MSVFRFTSLTGWLAIMVLTTGTVAVYFLRTRPQVSLPDGAAGKASEDFFLGLRVHYYLGYAAAALVLGHSVAPVLAGFALRSNPIGLIAAAGAFCAIAALVATGLRLRSPALLQRNKKRRWHFRLMAAAAVLTTVHLACNSPAAAALWRTNASAGIPTEKVVHPESRVAHSQVTASGSIRLKVGAEVRVGAQISGVVKKLNVTVGSHVQKGELIAEIAARGLDERIASASAQVRIDEVNARRAARDFERNKRLSDAGVLSAADAENLALTAAAADATLEKARADLSIQKVDLDYVRIRAPISGIVSSVSTQEGETIVTSFATPTFVTIIQSDALELVAMIDETDVAAIKPDAEVDFAVEAYPDREFRGTVKRIAPTATIVSGVVNYEVTVALAPAEVGDLKPDMTANLVVKTGETRGLYVPDGAILAENGERLVRVREGAILRKRAVLTGARDSGFTEIKRGVRAEDEIIIPAITERP